MLLTNVRLEDVKEMYISRSFLRMIIKYTDKQN